MKDMVILKVVLTNKTATLSQSIAFIKITANRNDKWHWSTKQYKWIVTTQHHSHICSCKHNPYISTYIAASLYNLLKFLQQLLM